MHRMELKGGLTPEATVPLAWLPRAGGGRGFGRVVDVRIGGELVATVPGRSGRGGTVDVGGRCWQWRREVRRFVLTGQAGGVVAVVEPYRWWSARWLLRFEGCDVEVVDTPWRVGTVQLRDEQDAVVGVVHGFGGVGRYTAQVPGACHDSRVSHGSVSGLNLSQWKSSGEEDDERVERYFPAVSPSS